MRVFVYAWRLRKSETCAVQLPAGLPWCAPPMVNGPLPPPADLSSAVRSWRCSSSRLAVSVSTTARSRDPVNASHRQQYT